MSNNRTDTMAIIAVNGIVDKPASEIPDATDDAKSTGLQAMAGPFRVENFERVFGLTSLDCETNDSEEWIDPRFVLATAWKRSRLENAQNLLAKGREAPPILVTGNLFPGLPPFFSVTDGMHRAVAARLAGHEQIKAQVSGYWICSPARRKIINGALWHQRNRGWIPSGLATNEPFGVCDAAAALGVEVQWSWWWRLYRGLRR